MSSAEMTIEGNIYQPTDSLILPSPRFFYAANIPVKHWQLRSLISFQDPDILYYVSDSDLYRLNTVTRKRALITTLPFSARSIAAGHGWLCAAGPNNGLFAAVKLDDHLPAVNRRQTRRPTDIDALLPILTESEVRAQNLRELIFPDERSSPSRRRKPELIVEEFGGEIMNSVTIHQAPEGSKWATDGPVAVLSNNDMTVRIYSLTQRRLLRTLEFPSSMNHATISPDGSLLMAVGDEAYVFFYKRAGSTEPATSNPRRHWSSSSYKWEFVAKYELTPAPDPANDGCFTTAFSPSGHLCAVASQDGMTTVFDSTAIANPSHPDHDPIIEIMPSSRLHSHWGEGAVRAMCFSPEPWDLLICAEHSGRVCVTDIRSRFRVRQTVKLYHDSDAVERIEVHDDVAMDDVIDPRLRSTAESEFIRQYHDTMNAHDEAAAAEFAAEYVEVSAERRRLERQARNESPQPFTERERQMLDSLRTSRERIEARNQLPISVNYQLTRNPRDSTPSLLPIDSGLPTSEVTITTNSTAAARILRHQLRERNLDLENPRSRPYEPQRRSSVILSQNESIAGTASATPSRMRAEQSDRLQVLDAVMTSGYDPYGPNPRLRHEGEALREARETGLLNRGHMIMLMELERRNARRLMEVRRRQRLRSLYAEVEGRGHYRFDGLSETERESSLKTTGCAMSRDGTKLFVGTEKGIFEYHVNIQGRKCFPQVMFR